MLSWKVLGRRDLVLSQCKGRKFQVDTKDSKMEMNIVSSRNKGREVSLEKGKQGESMKKRKTERSQTQDNGLW